jgi:hypothetical protein
LFFILEKNIAKNVAKLLTANPILIGEIKTLSIQYYFNIFQYIEIKIIFSEPLVEDYGRLLIKFSYVLRKKKTGK